MGRGFNSLSADQLTNESKFMRFTDRYKQEDALPWAPEPTASPMKLKLMITIGVMAIIALPCYYAVLFWILSALNAPTWAWVAYVVYLASGYAVSLYSKWLFAEAEEQARIEAVKKFQEEWHKRYEES